MVSIVLVVMQFSKCVTVSEKLLDEGNTGREKTAEGTNLSNVHNVERLTLPVKDEEKLQCLYHTFFSLVLQGRKSASLSLFKHIGRNTLIRGFAVVVVRHLFSKFNFVVVW